MKKNYDLKKLKWKPNPYIKHLKKPVTVRLDEDVIEYFRGLSEKEGIPYQTLMNLFLRFCKEESLQLETNWKKARGE
jgi:uncharacterized protein (DUF4415 family)